MDEQERIVPKCPGHSKGECPRPHDKQTCLDMLKYDSDFSEVMERYVQFVRCNKHRVPSKKQLKQAGIMPNWKKLAAVRSQ